MNPSKLVCIFCAMQLFFCVVDRAYANAEKSKTVVKKTGKAPKVYGKFVGVLQLQPTSNGNMKLLAPFGFKQNDGTTWMVPIGSETDGASIPSALWSLVGAPFRGKYLPAAVIHDEFVRTKHRDPPRTHRVFFEAMLANGVELAKAKLYYAAVIAFGPRWIQNESRCWSGCAGGNIYIDEVTITRPFDKDVFDAMRKIVEKDPDMEVNELISRSEKEEEVDANGIPIGESVRIRGYVGGAHFGEEDGFTRAEHGPFYGTDERRYVDFVTNGYFSGGGKVEDPGWEVINVAPNDRLNVRAGPSANHDVIGHIPHNGEKINLIERCRSLWCKVRYQSIEGWVNTSYLAPDHGQPSSADE